MHSQPFPIRLLQKFKVDLSFQIIIFFVSFNFLINSMRPRVCLNGQSQILRDDDLVCHGLSVYSPAGHSVE